MRFRVSTPSGDCRPLRAAAARWACAVVPASDTSTPAVVAMQLAQRALVIDDGGET